LKYFLQYSGTKNSSASFLIRWKKVISKQSLPSNPSNNTAIITTNLTADRLEQLYIEPKLPANKEVNVHNNSQRFAVEVIDQKNRV
jgi:hypothetical protein